MSQKETDRIEIEILSRIESKNLSIKKYHEFLRISQRQ
jgi:hypothetical protein